MNDIFGQILSGVDNENWWGHTNPTYSFKKLNFLRLNEIRIF